MSVDPISTAVEVWTAALRAKSLVEGITGTYDNASDRVKGLAFNIDQYRSIFNDFQSILRKEQKTPEGYDGFVQTLKECDHILENYKSLQNRKEFGVKPKLSPMVLFQSFRYVYSDKDIARLEGRIVQHMTAMNAHVNVMIAKKFLAPGGMPRGNEIHGTKSGDAKQQSKRYTLPERIPEPLNLANRPKEGEKLYDTADRIQYRAKRVGPQAQSSSAFQLDDAEFQRALEILRQRLLRNEPQPLPNSTEDSGENDFLETSQERLKLFLSDESDILRFSQERLKTLLSALRNQPAPTIRIRVFGPDLATFSLPLPAIADSRISNLATIFIPGTDLPPFNLHSIDIVRDGETRMVVCTEESKQKGLIHYCKLEDFLEVLGVANVCWCTILSKYIASADFGGTIVISQSFFCWLYQARDDDCHGSALFQKLANDLEYSQLFE